MEHVRGKLVLTLRYSYLSRVTIGYHRLYSHRAFRASYSVRLVLSILGASAFQGSIKVCSAFTGNKNPG